jgi:hypothetical protein
VIVEFELFGVVGGKTTTSSESWDILAACFQQIVSLAELEGEQRNGKICKQNFCVFRGISIVSDRDLIVELANYLTMQFDNGFSLWGEAFALFEWFLNCLTLGMFLVTLRKNPGVSSPDTNPTTIRMTKVQVNFMTENDLSRVMSTDMSATYNTSLYMENCY